MKQQLDYTVRVTAHQLNLAQAVEMETITLDAEQRRMLLSGLGGDQEGLAQARKVIQETLKTSAARLAEMKTLSTGESQKHVAAITSNLQQWQASHAEVETFIAAGDASTAWEVARKTSGPLLDKARAAADTLVANQESAFTASVESSDAKMTFMRNVLTGAEERINSQTPIPNFQRVGHWELELGDRELTRSSSLSRLRPAAC
jgi:hypothetical protein